MHCTLICVSIHSIHTPDMGEGAELNTYFEVAIIVLASIVVFMVLTLVGISTACKGEQRKRNRYYYCYDNYSYM